MTMNWKTGTTILFFILFALPAKGAPARTIYIDAESAVVEEDGTKTAPFKKIQAAVDAASAGDTLRIAPGCYQERIVVDKADVTIVGSGRSCTIIDAGVVGLKDEGQNCFTFKAPNIYLARLTMRHGLRPVEGHNVGKVTIASCHIESSSAYLKFVDSQVSLINCSIVDVPVDASYGTCFWNCQIEVIGNHMSGNKRGVMTDLGCKGFVKANIMYRHTENGVLCARETNDLYIDGNLFLEIDIYAVGWRQKAFPWVMNNTIINSGPYCGYKDATFHKTFGQGKYFFTRDNFIAGEKEGKM